MVKLWSYSLWIVPNNIKITHQNTFFIKRRNKPNEISLKLSFTVDALRSINGNKHHLQTRSGPNSFNSKKIFWRVILFHNDTIQIPNCKDTPPPPKAPWGGEKAWENELLPQKDFSVRKYTTSIFVSWIAKNLTLYLLHKVLIQPYLSLHPAPCMLIERQFILKPIFSRSLVLFPWPVQNSHPNCTL